MVFTARILRFFHSRTPCLAAEKSLLATLRKTTGYTFANCKKALQLHNNDLGAAQKWLQEQAQSMGWAKATKLEGRTTSQGLIGVTVRGSCAAMVELNCETDFVARNDEFKNVVALVANTCLDLASCHQHTNGPITRIWLSEEQLKCLQPKNGKTLSDVMALMIGTVGENASLKRAMCLKVRDGIHLAGYAHPASDQFSNVNLGKFGGVVAFKQTLAKDNVDLGEIGKGICQHIVGMNPKKIGKPSDEPSKNKEDETCLIHQEYLLDDEMTVQGIMEENGIEVVEFTRFQCGETLLSGGDQPLEYVETCQ